MVHQEDNINELNEPNIGYGNFSFYQSFEEQETASLHAMALLTPLERLQQLRKLINTAYGMHGFNPNKLPQRHSIKIILGEAL
jgi:hypothetical protein